MSRAGGTVSEQSVTPTPVTWISELLTRLPSHSLLAALFVYYILYVIPGREAWFWEQIEAQRSAFADTRKENEARTTMLLKDAHEQCNAAIETALSTGKDQRQINTQLIEKNQELLKNLMPT